MFYSIYKWFLFYLKSAVFCLHRILRKDFLRRLPTINMNNRLFKWYLFKIFCIRQNKSHQTYCDKPFGYCTCQMKIVTTIRLPPLCYVLTWISESSYQARNIMNVLPLKSSKEMPPVNEQIAKPTTHIAHKVALIIFVFDAFCWRLNEMTVYKMFSLLWKSNYYFSLTCMQMYTVPKPKAKNAPKTCTVNTFVSWKLPTILTPKEDTKPNQTDLLLRFSTFSLFAAVVLYISWISLYLI